MIFFARCKFGKCVSIVVHVHDLKNKKTMVYKQACIHFAAQFAFWK